MTSEKLITALAHPARRAALERIAQGPASPDDIAKELGLNLGVVAYHVRKLHEAKIIRLHREERIRGAVKHVYRLAAVNGLADDVRDAAAAMEGLAITLSTASADASTRDREEALA